MAVNTPSAHITPDAKKRLTETSPSVTLVSTPVPYGSIHQTAAPAGISTKADKTDPKPARLMSGLPSESPVLVSTTTQDCSPTPNEIATPDLSFPLQP